MSDFVTIGRLSRFYAKMRTALIPVGTVQLYTGNTAPSGFLLCDGAAVSRTTYSKLFAVVGTKYGKGNGSTTFNLPDLRPQTAATFASSRTWGDVSLTSTSAAVVVPIIKT